MKKFILFFSILCLTGCSTVKDYFPSFWDSNQSKIVTDIQQSTRNFNCNGNIAEQAKALSLQVQWLQIYSETKDTRDVSKIISLMSSTVNELSTRSATGSVSPIYCELKKNIMTDEANMIGHMIQGRF
jgi:outer membrane biogenesis lipoprotein LolB